MPRKLQLQLVACLVAVTAWGAGIPLVNAASTSNDTGAGGSYEAAHLSVPAAVYDEALAFDTGSLAEKWLMAARRAEWTAAASVPARAPDLGPSNQTAPEPVAQPTAGRDSEPQSTPKPQGQPDSTPKADPTAKPDATPRPDPKPQPTPVPKPEPKPEPKPDPSYQGTTHLWYPALGISANWRWYGCEHGGDPSGLGAGVYRWSCVGGKNVYMMSHAWSTFAAVRRGYHSGRMDVGQHAWYADGGGNVAEYRVKWIKRVDTDYFMRTFGSWAAEATSSSVLTLQTCDGSNNQYRIIVRMVAV